MWNVPLQWSLPSDVTENCDGAEVRNDADVEREALCRKHYEDIGRDGRFSARVLCF